MVHHKYRTFVFAMLLTSVFGVINDVRRDSYLSAYMDSQSPTEIPPGIVYPEPVRNYGPPQHTPYYGPPEIPSNPPLEYSHPPVEYAHPYSALLEIIMHLPKKLEFLPKISEVLLIVTKILLKVVLLKIILKFVVMFCLFFFLPKVGMLDIATEVDSAQSDIMMSPVNNTSASSSEDQEETRLNRMTNFIWDSVENQPFLKKYCKNSNENKLKCKVLRTLSNLEKNVTVPRLLNTIGLKNKLEEIISKSRNS